MKKHSPRARAFRYTLVLPLAALFILLFQQAPAIAQEVKKKYEVQLQTAKTPAEKVFPLEKNTNSTPCDQPPSFPGGLEKLPEFIAENLKYPAPVNGEFQEGMVVVSFTVKPDGYIKDVHLTEPSGMPPAFDAEALRVISKLPQWTPGKKDCKSAEFELCVPIKFKADGTPAPLNAADQVMDLFDVQSVPQFPGGDKAMMDYFVQNIKYPENIKNDTQLSSKVIAFRFVVEKDGGISNIEVLNPAGFDERLVAEGIRAIGAMPKWTPGMKDGAPERVYFTLPIRFKMK